MTVALFLYAIVLLFLCVTIKLVSVRDHTLLSVSDCTPFLRVIVLLCLRVTILLFSLLTLSLSLPQVTVRCSGGRRESEAMGCTSAKQVSAVPSDEEGRAKAYSNGDLFTGQSARRVTIATPIRIAVLRFLSPNCPMRSQTP